MLAAGVAVGGNLIVAVMGTNSSSSPLRVDNVSIAIALILSIAALLNFPAGRRRGVELSLLALDVLVVGGSMVLITSVLVYSRLTVASDGGIGSRSVAMVFPALDVVLVTVAVLLVLNKGSWWLQDF